MKHVKTFETYIALNEINMGKAEPYEWEFRDAHPSDDGVTIYNYVFFSDSKEYGAHLSYNKLTQSLDVKFGLRGYEDGRATDTDFDSLTGEGKVFSVLATIVDMVRHVSMKETIEEIVFTGGPKHGDNPAEAEKRTKLYVEYVKQLLPVENVFTSGNLIRIDVGQFKGQQPKKQFSIFPKPGSGTDHADIVRQQGRERWPHRYR